MMKTIACFVVLTVPIAAAARERHGQGGDPVAIARQISATFEAACAAGNVKAIAALYADDATVVWPPQGAVATSKAGIEKLATALCTGPSKAKATLKDLQARWLERHAVATLGQWELTMPGSDGGPVTLQVRTTEVLVRTADGWRYALDHASVGLPAAANPAGAST